MTDITGFFEEYSSKLKTDPILGIIGYLLIRTDHATDLLEMTQEVQSYLIKNPRASKVTISDMPTPQVGVLIALVKLGLSALDQSIEGAITKKNGPVVVSVLNMARNSAGGPDMCASCADVIQEIVETGEDPEIAKLMEMAFACGTGDIDEGMIPDLP